MLPNPDNLPTFLLVPKFYLGTPLAHRETPFRANLVAAAVPIGGASPHFPRESVHNPAFNSGEFAIIKSRAGLNTTHGGADSVLHQFPLKAFRPQKLGHTEPFGLEIRPKMYPSLLILVFCGQTAFGQITSFNPLTPNATSSAIKAYELGIQTLSANPTVLDSLDPKQLEKMLYQINGWLISGKLPDAERDALKLNETKLIGQILQSLVSRVDMSITAKEASSMVYSYPPFEEVADPHDRGDSKKQAAYEAAVKAKLARGDYIDSQFELRKTIGNATLQSKYYLAQMFPNEDDVAAILKNAKISDAVIKLLTHPLEDSVYPFKE